MYIFSQRKRKKPWIKLNVKLIAHFEYTKKRNGLTVI